jgi:hypothetical protein
VESLRQDNSRLENALRRAEAGAGSASSDARLHSLEADMQAMRQEMVELSRQKQVGGSRWGLGVCGGGD